ncbi:alkaline ceramidase 3 [Diplogelasinospora grovesii]|uniref:Alkaline ceramidase 3 n=1 Tax=Diplogelasinospora grovesii TaxID=303347 RepID=A0AAN6S057_9PEZI|nr:alkaline ceramidase 3 [Diplogelasinospora grovesii]
MRNLDTTPEMALAGAFQIPYREARDGFWGEQTSTLNWCEEDYNVTYYCAEMVNTLTNLVFIWLGIKGIRNVIKYSHDPVFILAYLGYIVVGLGSMAFHATLQYSMQLADELPMIYTVCIMGYANFSYKQPPKTRLLVAGAMMGLAGSITAYYLHAKDPTFHQAAYTLLTLATIGRGFYVTEHQLRPALRKRNPAECDQLMGRMHALAWTGIIMFLSGFCLWSLDTIFCRHIITARNRILLPWAALLEGHGWWHILTGLAYHLITWRVWLSRCLDGSEREFMLDWTPLRSAPQVVPRRGASVATPAIESKKIQ